MLQDYIPPHQVVQTHHERFAEIYDFARELAWKRHKHLPGEFLKELYEEGLKIPWWSSVSGFANELDISHEMATRIVEGRFHEVSHETLEELALDHNWPPQGLNDREKRRLILEHICQKLVELGFASAFNVDLIDEIISTVGCLPISACSNESKFWAWVKVQQSAFPKVSESDVWIAGFYLYWRRMCNGYGLAAIRAAFGNVLISEAEAIDFKCKVMRLGLIRREIKQFWDSTNGQRKLHRCKIKKEAIDVLVFHLADRLQIEPSAVRVLLDMYHLPPITYVDRSHGELIELSPATRDVAKVAWTSL